MKIMNKLKIEMVMVKNRIQYFIKTIFDKIIALLALLLLSPTFVIIYIAIKMDDGGSVLFKQKRIGQHGKNFVMYKFRTMFKNAVDIRNPDGSTYNSANDHRVTKVGRILRTLSLDELAQLINILKGEMSFIGPRPDLPDALDKYDDNQLRKLDVLPGVTGLAQVKGRNEIPHSKRLEYDLKYIDEYSLVLDFKILLKTLVNVVSAKGVYIKQDKD